MSHRIHHQFAQQFPFQAFTLEYDGQEHLMRIQSSFLMPHLPEYGRVYDIRNDTLRGLAVYTPNHPRLNHIFYGVVCKGDHYHGFFLGHKHEELFEGEWAKQHAGSWHTARSLDALFTHTYLEAFRQAPKFGKVTARMHQALKSEFK